MVFAWSIVLPYQLHGFGQGSEECRGGGTYTTELPDCGRFADLVGFGTRGPGCYGGVQKIWKRDMEKIKLRSACFSACFCGISGFGI